jgi:hypothetical protein
LGTLAPAVGTPQLPENGSEDVARAAAPGDGIEVHLIGDSVALNLLQNFDPTQTAGINLSASTRLGCGPLPESLIVAGKQLPYDPACGEWAATWLAQVVAARPEVAVFFANMDQLFDIEVDGAVLHFGAPVHDERLRRRYLGALGELKRVCPHVVIVNLACNRVYDDGKNRIANILNDDSRVQHVNSIIKEIAAKADVPVIDVDAWLCRGGGDPEHHDGVKMRFDGLHYTHEGARLVWKWLGPQLVALGASAPRRHAVVGSETRR